MKRSIGLHHHHQANIAHEPGLRPRRLPLDPHTALAATVAASYLHLVDQRGPNQALQAPSGAPTAAPAAEMNRGATVE